jgi:D-psicose/D-tagatose/L-ribulose 3-epimerase
MLVESKSMRERPRTLLPTALRKTRDVHPWGVEMFKFGVDSFIWTEIFEEKDLWIIPKAKELGFEVLDLAIAHPEQFPLAAVQEELKKVDIEVVTTTTLDLKSNLISPDPGVRRVGVRLLKKLIDINNSLRSPICGGVNYAAWGYLTKKPRTSQEWEWSVTAMREAARYAKETGSVALCVEPVNRFETHFINTAADAVRYCKDVGTGNVKVHLDTFHMNIEETDFAQAVRECGRTYLGYVHTCENNRGIPGTGHVPWKDFFLALDGIGFHGPLVIESFDPSFEELSGNCAIWRHFAESGEVLAVEGIRNLRKIASSIGQ